MQLFEEVLCETALPQSNLHASSPSKSTTASFIYTNLTIHASQSSQFAMREYLSPVSPIIRNPSSHRPPITHSRFSKRANSKNTAELHPVRARSSIYLVHVPFAHREQQRNSSLQGAFWCTSSPYGHGKRIPPPPSSRKLSYL